MKFTFSIPGEPKGKGRPRFTRSGQTYTPKATRDYEKLVAQTYKAEHGYWYGREMIAVRIVAYFGIPKSMSMKRRTDMIGTHPTKRPDADNIVKAVLDGLNSVAYEDDCQVYSISITKLYGLDPHVLVTISDEVEDWT